MGLYFPSLVTIGDDLKIRDNLNLSDLGGLSMVASVGGDLLIDSNTSLDSLTSLYSVGTVEGNFTIVDNPVLPTDEAVALQQEIGTANIGGTITISGNE